MNLLQIEDHYGAHNYKPLPVVVSEAKGVWVTDIEGNRYLDCLSAYSAVNQGHCHPRLIKALTEQAAKVTLTSRAFHNDQLPLFCKELAELCGMDGVLPMNTGAEAVETAVKMARRWGYGHKPIAEDAAEIVVCANNFHGRTTTIVSFSSDSGYRRGFGPFTPGFKIVPFGDIDALRDAIGPNTVAFLTEPIQAEAGILMPPDGYLRAAADLCRQNDVLFMADEIQTGLGRTGRWLTCEYEEVKPDVLILGKALSGGFYPVSAVLARRDVLDVFTPGSHGSTYGGNPLGCAVAREALAITKEERLPERSADLGTWLLKELNASLKHPDIVEIRGRGLLIGIELSSPARPFCEALKELGMLCKETHDTIIRLAPPLIIEQAELEWMVDKLRQVLG
ncbi:ornithine--oxo-acid transaminase [bacterium]|nr:MAG: ornithine--oxo-acid transaminase [bacterium]